MNKKSAGFRSAWLILFLLFPLVANAVDFPRPAGFVNDFAAILQPADRAALENILTNFERETSNEIVVVIVDSFQGLDRFTYSQQLFTDWGIGKKNRDNGVLFLIGPKEGFPFPERGEAQINVGRGLEGALTDSISGSILRNEVFPAFKTRNYFAGVEKGVNAIMQATKGEYKATAILEERDWGGLIIFGIWLGMLLLQYLASFLGRTKSWWPGGVLGGIGGVILGFIFLSGIFILIAAFGLGLFGLLFDYIFSKNYEERRRKGLPTDFWHSGGGFWFGGGRGFGGGGGFGGFGGGGSGGGGAGGGW